MSPLVSVIIPVYKVEDYLDDTVSCMLNQTYSNLEIILVDDGSPDRCGEMCDAYAVKDARVKVIHKPNGGLSSARNAGVEVCKGDYIAFIDSDDVASTDYIEFLLRLCQNYKADMAVCLTRDFQDGNQPVYDLGIDYTTTYMSGKQSLEKLFYFSEIRTGVIAKLFTRKLLPWLNFQVGIYYEDAKPMYHAHAHAAKVALGRAYKFAYRHRRTSQSRQGFSLREMDCVYEWTDIYTVVTQDMPSLQKAAACRAFSAYAHIFFIIPKNGFESEKKECWRHMRRLRNTVLKDRKARRKARMCALLTLSGMKITHRLGKKLIYEG